METEKDFSRYGRVNYVLAKRLELLEEVSKLQKSLGVVGGVSYTYKTVSMTCTHAALKRQELVKLGFKYNSILMGESAQNLEIVTFIPLLLQNLEDGTNRLKR